MAPTGIAAPNDRMVTAVPKDAVPKVIVVPMARARGPEGRGPEGDRRPDGPPPVLEGRGPDGDRRPERPEGDRRPEDAVLKVIVVPMARLAVPRGVAPTVVALKVADQWAVLRLGLGDSLRVGPFRSQ